MRLFVVTGATILALAACATGSPDTADDAVDGEAAVDGIDPTTAPEPTADSTPPATAAPRSQMPESVEPGTTTTLRTKLADGTDLLYAVVVPEDFDPSVEYPVLLAMPPGGQDAGLTVNVTEGTYATEAIARGWVVVSPAAPDGTLYFQGSESLIPEFLDETLSWLRPEGDRFHVAGISNGGLSAFRVAALYPGRFASMVVFPGFARTAEDQAALAGFEFPVAMFVGGNDTGWIGPMEATLEALVAGGVTASLEIREGEGHVMQSLGDGVDIFDFLDDAR